MRLSRLPPFRRVTVQGSSMQPTLVAGDRLVVRRSARLRPGQIVAVPDPRNRAQLLVKRVSSIDPGARLISLEGDNPDESTDSRTFGPVAWDDVVGRAVYRYFPPDRAGRLPRARSPGSGTVDDGF